MANNLKSTESKFFEQARTALTNAATNQVIKDALASFGYNDALLAEGNSLFESTKATWEYNIVEDAETVEARSEYHAKYDEIEVQFKRHRDMARILFRKKPSVLVELGIEGHFPRTYNDLFDRASRYYAAVKNNGAIQQEIRKIKVTPELADASIASLAELKHLRSNYDSEISESQEATKTKNAAIHELKDWMDDFYDTAELALYDQPQLLEALGVFVRS